MRKIFFDIVFFDEHDSLNDNLAKYCKERIILYRIMEDGTFCVKMGPDWFPIVCEQHDSFDRERNRYILYSVHPRVH